jgi:hypothetical protein
MKRQISVRQFLLFAFVTALLITLNIQALAQKADYKPGEKIECKTSYSKDEWAECTFVEKSYDGSQPIIRDAQGFQKGLPNWDWVRPLAKPAEEPADQDKRAEEENNAPQDRAAPQGQGLMSQADILNFLKTNLGADPFANPRLEAIKAELAKEIKGRGLNFHFQTASDFFNELAKYGAITTDITFPLKDNYGAPTEQSWLMGAWRLDKIGATTDYERDGYIYRKEASAAASVGNLTINTDGTYVWQANAPAATFKGRWRKATSAEMKTQGGDGIVLLKAKSDWDWIVTQNRAWTTPGDLIWISELGTRQVREIGSRRGR